VRDEERLAVGVLGITMTADGGASQLLGRATMLIGNAEFDTLYLLSRFPMRRVLRSH
jgi:hypothetical protein